MKVLAAVSAVCLISFFTLALPHAAQAQTVWRCGADGRTYSESPCPGGRLIKAADPRAASELQAARDEVKRSQELGTRMRKERLEDEKRNRAANALAANLGPATADKQRPEKIKPPKAKAKAPQRHQLATAEGDGTLRSAAAPFRRKQD